MSEQGKKSSAISAAPGIPDNIGSKALNNTGANKADRERAHGAPSFAAQLNAIVTARDRRIDELIYAFKAG